MFDDNFIFFGKYYCNKLYADIICHMHYTLVFHHNASQPHSLTASPLFPSLSSFNQLIEISLPFTQAKIPKAEASCTSALTILVKCKFQTNCDCL